MKDYPVGYKRPPVHTRFKPGKSGNPRGRPKGRKSFLRVFDDILNEKVTVRHGDEVRKASPKEVMSRTVIHKAMKGDLKAFSQVVSVCQQSGQFEPEPDPIEVIQRVLITPDGKHYPLPSNQSSEEKTPFDFDLPNQHRSRK